MLKPSFILEIFGIFILLVIFEIVFFSGILFGFVIFLDFNFLKTDIQLGILRGDFKVFESIGWIFSVVELFKVSFIILKDDLAWIFDTRVSTVESIFLMELVFTTKVDSIVFFSEILNFFFFWYFLKVIFNNILLFVAFEVVVALLMGMIAVDFESRNTSWSL